MPARLAIFVAQLGRKFRLISLTMQRYESFIAVYEFSGENFSIFALAAARCSVAVLEKASPHPTFTPIYLYIFIYIDI